MKSLLAGVVILVGCSGGGGTTDGGTGGDGGGSGTPCTFTWSGAISGTTPCNPGSDNDKLLGVTTAATVGWLVIQGPTAEHNISFGFHLTKPPAAMTYPGTTMDGQFCTASLAPKAGPVGTWSASSKPLSSGMPQGSCSITFTSLVDTSSSATSRYVVHGTATATLVKTSDMSMVTLNVTF
jgi:hypothetical protein